MSATLTVNIKAESLMAMLKGFRPRFRAKMLLAVTRLSLEIQRSVKEDKLSGQVLHVRTGTLRRSINQRIEEKADGIYGYVGTNVRYAGAHEYGFKGTVTVKEHLRREKKVIAAKYNAAKDVWIVRKKNTGFSGIVKSHTMTMNLPERSFLRSTLSDFTAKIKEGMQIAARDALVSK